MKFKLATTDDKLKDVFLVYGKEIDKRIILPKELEDFTFYLNDSKYIGGDFNFIEGISELLTFTFDNKWFVEAINKFLFEFDKKCLLPKCKDEDTIIISYVVVDK